MEHILGVRNLEAGYDGKNVLQGVSLHVGRGEIVGLVGPNGAGKSTLLKAVFGLLSTRNGTIEFKSQEIQNRSPSLNVRDGLAYVMQGARVFTELSVQENLEMGGYVLHSREELGARIEAVYELLPVLSERRRQSGSDLSSGEKQMLALGRALVLRPDLLLLDEPSVGLAPRVAERVLSSVKELSKRSGTAILLVEQNVQETLSVCERLYVLRLGQVVLEARPATVTTERLREAFLG